MRACKCEYACWYMGHGEADAMVAIRGPKCGSAGVESRPIRPCLCKEGTPGYLAPSSSRTPTGIHMGPQLSPKSQLLLRHMSRSLGSEKELSPIGPFCKRQCAVRVHLGLTSEPIPPSQAAPDVGPASELRRRSPGSPPWTLGACDDELFLTRGI